MFTKALIKTRPMVAQSSFNFAKYPKSLQTHLVLKDDDANKFQQTQMLFFQDKKAKNSAKSRDLARPRTISEIKKVQSFVQNKKTQEGESLNESIRKLSKKDETFNDFFKEFKAKNEQGWANIIDLTQKEQEDQFLQITPEMRKNEMIMLEEFRRRKNLKDYWEKVKDYQHEQASTQKIRSQGIMDERQSEFDTFKSSGPERFFEPGAQDTFDPSEFSMIFMDSDSVTNVTSLNRTNNRRVLIFFGNGNGLITYGIGKAGEYEQAFDNAFKYARQNMIMLDIDQVHTCPQILQGRHNDFKIKIFPQDISNYWGNPTIWEMLKCSGILHCRYTCISRKRDPYSLIYGYFNAVHKIRRASTIQTLRGERFNRIGYINPTTNSLDYRAALFHAST